MGINLAELPSWLIYPLLIFLVALIAHRLAWHLAGLLLRPVIRPSFPKTRFFGRFRRLNSDVDATHERRRKTLQQLIASVISVFAFLTAVVFGLSHVVGWDTLLWMAGFLTAAFGFGARTLISDLLAGFNIIFEDIFGVGEKIEINNVVMTATGVVEHVSLRTTWIRAPSGELFVVPNGDIRIVRNFSRGRFSMANIMLKTSAADLQEALPLLKELGKDRHNWGLRRINPGRQSPIWPGRGSAAAFTGPGTGPFD